MPKRRRKNERPDSRQKELPLNRNQGRRYWMVGLAATLIVASVVVLTFPNPSKPVHPAKANAANQAAGEHPATGNPPANNNPPAAAPQARYVTSGKLTMVWEPIKPEILQRVSPTSTISNLTRSDYAGAEACQKCHRENFADWANHPHRWMNAIASDQTVRGDFSGTSEIHYLGGVAKFYRSGTQFRMRYDRGELHREYEIHQTIGSRYYQYYVGVGLEGPEDKRHSYYRVDHVLPFGFWLSRKEWVPIVHVDEELPDGQRWESVEQLKPVRRATAEGVGKSRGTFDPSSDLALTYADSCNFCHTTFAAADSFVRNPERMGSTLPSRSLFELSKFVSESHPNIYDGKQPPESVSGEALQAMTATFIHFDARQEGVSLGVACEACHLGCLHHVQNPETKPAFIPQSPNLLVFNDAAKPTTGRSAANTNAICGRCHVGQRPTYAAGMATWNSTEHTDAMKGSCYSQLTCSDCHNPHKPTGMTWEKTADQDDQSCIRCHQQFQQPQTRQAHTHHIANSSGDRCMNCHMPHINEGMQDVVRTHTIFSPTNEAMLKANQPNACNLCHLDKPIEWTLNYLRQWYQSSPTSIQIGLAPEDLREPAGLRWLKHTHAATRIAAVAAFARQKATWGTTALVPLLDDPYLLNRQFTQVSLESLLGRSLSETTGYRYYESETRRAEAIKKLKALLAEPKPSANTNP